MRADGIFNVRNFTPTDLIPTPAIQTGMPVGISTMEKTYQGQIAGRSATLFTAAFDQASGAGSYLAMESFEGTLDSLSGAFNFMHSATTTGRDRTNVFFAIVPGSGTGDLKGITGTGGLLIDTDGTHRIWFEYQIAI